MEKEIIIDALLTIFEGADERDWKKILDLMAENVQLDYSSLTGKPSELLSSKEIVDAWKNFLPGFDRTHHQLSKFRVDIHGNSATVHFYGKADHFLGEEVWTVDGDYDAEVIRMNDGWVVSALTFYASGQTGNLNLPAIAIQKMAINSSH